MLATVVADSPWSAVLMGGIVSQLQAQLLSVVVREEAMRHPYMAASVASPTHCGLSSSISRLGPAYCCLRAVFDSSTYLHVDDSSINL